MTDSPEVVFGPLRKFTQEKIRKIIVNAAANLTEDTPVDTGHAANNWVPSLDAPFTGVDGTRENPSDAAHQAGLQEVLAYQLPQVGYVANNVPYIRSLNEGHSQQAPAQFVEAALLRAVREAAQG